MLKSRPQPKKLYIIGALSIVLAAILWSLDGVFLRPQLYALPVTLVVFWEHFLGFIALSPFLWIYRQEIKLMSWRQWMAVIWIGALGGLLGTLFITKAFFLANFTNLSVILLLQKLQPLFAIGLAFLILREKLENKFYLWAGLAIVSGYLVSFGWQVPNFSGTQLSIPLLALAAAFAFGSSTTFGKYAVRTINFRLLSALRFIITTLIILPFIFLSLGKLNLPNSTELTTLILIVFSSGALAMFLYYYGLKKVSASQATLLELAWPVSAITLDYLINKNVLSLAQIIGSALLILAVYKISILKPIYPQIKGIVIPGAGLAKKMGFRTANLDPRLAKNLGSGVYFAEVEHNHQSYSGLLHYGHNSLQNNYSLEVLIKDFDQDIYNEELIIKPKYKIREVRKFRNRQQAMKRIAQDYKFLQ